MVWHPSQTALLPKLVKVIFVPFRCPKILPPEYHCPKMFLCIQKEREMKGTLVSSQKCFFSAGKTLSVINQEVSRARIPWRLYPFLNSNLRWLQKSFTKGKETKENVYEIWQKRRSILWDIQWGQDSKTKIPTFEQKIIVLCADNSKTCSKIPDTWSVSEIEGLATGGLLATRFWKDLFTYL